MSTTLFGKFIANTYQKVLQYDENEDYTGVASFNISELANNNKHTLLNGVGQAVPGIAIDHTDENNGGLFLKNTDKSSGAWGLQIEYGNGSGVDTDPGIQFWRPFGGNYHLFLKNTGTLFVGYQGESSVPSDASGYSLYVKDGVRVGGSGFSGTQAIQLIGQNSLIRVDYTGNFQFIQNSKPPFKIIRYSMFWTSPQVDNKTLLDDDGITTISSDDWTAVVVGFNCDLQNSDNSTFNNIICMTFRDSGIWKLRVGVTDTGQPLLFNDQTWNIDVLFIQKGWYSDTNRTGFGQPDTDVQI